MEARSIANYSAVMPNKKPRGGAKKPDSGASPALATVPDTEDTDAAPPVVPRLLGMALRDLRKQHAGTQEAFALLTGKSQSYVSAAERGKHGWDSANEWANAVGTVGGDPVDLLRLAVAHADPDPELREVLALWSKAPPHVRGAALILLRSAVAGQSGAR